VFSFRLKTFQLIPSNIRHMYKILNIDKKITNCIVGMNFTRRIF
jgi:hypothetical protein